MELVILASSWEDTLLLVLFCFPFCGNKTKRSVKLLGDAPWRSSELVHCKWNQDQASVFGLSSLVSHFEYHDLLHMPLKDVTLLWQHWDSREPVCGSALACLMERLCYRSTLFTLKRFCSVLMSSKISQVLLYRLLYYKVREPLKAFLDVNSHESGSKSLLYGETDVSRQMLFLRNRNSLHIHNSCKHQEFKSSLVIVRVDLSRSVFPLSALGSFCFEISKFKAAH